MKRLKNKYKAIIVLVISSISIFFAMTTGSSSSYRYYMWGVIAILSLYAIWEQMQKSKERKELKKLRDELLEAKWEQEMESRNSK